MGLTHAQSRLLDELRASTFVKVNDLVDRGVFASERAVALHIASLRRAGYLVRTIPALSGVRGTVYTLEGEV